MQYYPNGASEREPAEQRKRVEEKGIATIKR